MTEPVFSEDGIEVYHGDCLQVMPTLEAGSIDLVLCDLPYAVTNCAWDILIPFDALWKEYKRLLRPNGAVVLFGTQPFISLLVCSNLAWFKYDLVWDKESVTGHLNAQKMPLREHETILLFCKGVATYNPQKTHGEKNHTRKRRQVHIGIYGAKREIESDLSGMKHPTSIVTVSKNTHDKEQTFHPSQKPTALLQYLIRTYTNPGELVLDNTAGSFSTCVAAKMERRRAIGIEQEKAFVDIGIRRLAQGCLDLQEVSA